MKLRHLIAIFSFLAAFGLSVFFMRLFLTKPVLVETRLPPKQTVSVRSQGDLKVRMRQFLEADRQTGIEFSRSLTHFRGVTNEVSAEAVATGVLVRNMSQVYCLNLPDDFCAAWDAHFQAWTRKDKYFAQPKMRGKVEMDAEIRKDDLNLTSEINRTYDEMLAVARRYGVVFRN